MIYLIGKIVLSLLASLGIGFGMAWALQMHLAARLREQLNSVIFETKSRIPQLESEITNRDQIIDGLREDLARKPKPEENKKQAGSKEQEKQIDELHQKVIDLENELRMARGVTDSESVLEIADEDRVETEEPELMSDDEFLADIQDIFEDADDSIEAFGSASAESGADNAEPAPTKSEEESRKSLEDELQSELEGWADDDKSEGTPEPSADSVAGKDALPPKRGESKKKTSGPVDLKAELLDLEEEIRAGSKEASSRAESEQALEFEALRGEVESLSEARKQLNDIVDSQAREMSTMKQQRELQDKSLSVLNQQLELARMANERILRELREVKDANTPKDGKSHSASGG